MSVADPALQTSTQRPVVAIARLTFIDGLRGLAALAVCAGHFLHLWPAYYPHGSFTDATLRQRLVWLVQPGNYMVALFLAVSAFSLAYSEDVRRQLGRPATSIARFIRRRAWRIGPTYYVALAIALPVSLTVPSWVLAHHGASVVSTAAGTTTGGLLSHLVFLHNARASWLYQTNAPLWSLAYEVQFYAAFPLLYWAFRRYNGFVVLIPVWVGIFLAIRTVHTTYQLSLMYYFLLGVAAASMYRTVTRIPTWVFTVSGLLFLVIALDNPAERFFPQEDWLWAGAIALLLLAMTGAPEARWNPCNLAFLRWLGARSYSLYVIHFPILVATAWISAELHQAGSDSWVWLTFAIGLTASICAATVLHALVEKPSLRRVANT